jgi:O-methyltransferase
MPGLDAMSTTRDAYIDLLKRSLLGLTVGPVRMYIPSQRGGSALRTWVVRVLQRRGGSVLAQPVDFAIPDDTQGTVTLTPNLLPAVEAWGIPPWSKTMVGTLRLNNVEQCLRSVLEAGVPGDLIETGVWRGGTSIFMRGVLRAYGVSDREVYVADSFAGLPEPDTERYPADEGLDLHTWPGLAVELEEVQANFARYGLLDEQVRFVKGWFRDTLPKLRDNRWSLIRLDGDLYESTMDALVNLYPGLAPGGWVIVDDYEIQACAQAVDDYRQKEGITEAIQRVDWTGVCWQKQS